MSEPTFPETFVVQRDEDVSGISGEGIVAEGARFSDGWVVTHWLDRPPMNEPKTDVWHHKGVSPFRRIHGHDGRTRILWADDMEAARRKALADVVEAFDVPPEMCGTEAEGAYWREQIKRVLLDASSEARQRWDRSVWDVKATLGDLADAVMPVVAKLMDQRNQAQRQLAEARAQQEHDDAPAAPAPAATEAAPCDGYEPPTSADDSGFCARCGMYDYKHHGAPTGPGEARCQGRCEGVTGIRGLLEHVGIDTTGRDITVGSRVVDTAGPEDGRTNDRQACPYCNGGPQFLRTELGAHVREKHARVLAALAVGNLDDQLSGGCCDCPHEMEV